MDKKELIELTNKIYRLSILFPKKEPLRYKIRETADDILADFIRDPLNEKEDLVFALKQNLEILKGYLNVAKWQNWVSYFDILEIEGKYDSIYTKLSEKEGAKEEIIMIKDLPKISEVLPIENPILDIEEKKQDKKSSFPDRKDKIIEVLGQKEKVQVWEINQIFPDISKRTIRRDFVELLKLGLIERIGERSETFYKLRSHQS